MLEAIKNACIFLLIAQILMVLVPEEAYAKYVRVLVSLILILKITQPFLILISGREAQEVMQANVEQLYVELSVRELPSSIQRETGNLYAHMTEYVAGQIAQEQDLQKQDRQGHAFCNCSVRSMVDHSAFVYNLWGRGCGQDDHGK